MINKIKIQTDSSTEATHQILAFVSVVFFKYIMSAQVPSVVRIKQISRLVRRNRQMPLINFSSLDAINLSSGYKTNMRQVNILLHDIGVDDKRFLTLLGSYRQSAGNVRPRFRVICHSSTRCTSNPETNASWGIRSRTIQLHSMEYHH